jgi:hypothetical protein
MSEIIVNTGHIYLLKMCDTNHRIIYKIGKSINFYKRYKRYHYADIVILINSDDITTDKIEIKKLFHQNCTLDKGRDYFTSRDDYFTSNLILRYFSEKYNRNIEHNLII